MNILLLNMNKTTYSAGSNCRTGLNKHTGVLNTSNSIKIQDQIRKYRVAKYCFLMTNLQKIEFLSIHFRKI